MLYIRHAEKSYKNGDAIEFSLDPDLTTNGKQQAKIRFLSLFKDYGAPFKIISSPYLRARETAKIAQDVVRKETGKSVEIYYDVSIGEYLGHQTNISLEEGLRPETLALDPIPHETLKEYNLRMSQYTISKPQFGTCWHISHGFVIKSIAYFQGRKIPYPGPLEGIYIDEDGVSII